MATLRVHRYSILLFIAALVLGCKLIVDTDIWWHLAAGRWLWENHHPITQDPFSYTAAGMPWMSITWGYEALIYALSGSLAAVTAVHAVAGALALWLSWQTFRVLRATQAEGDGESLGAILFALGAWVIQFRWVDRPEVFTHLFGAAVLWILVRDWKARGTRVLYAIPAIQALWVNFHGLFAFGPILVGLFIVQDRCEGGTRTKALAKTLGLTLLACLLNPRGIAGALFPLHLFKVLTHPFYRRTIPEAGNPLADVIWGWDTRGFLIYAAISVAAILGWLWLKRDRRALGRQYGWGFLVLFAALFWLSITARRNIALLVLWTLPWIAALITEVAEERKALPPEIRWLGFAAPVLLILGGITNLAFPWDEGLRFGGGVLPHSHPEEAVRFIEGKRIPGPVFADVPCSNYLLFHLDGYHPYIDGRFAELYPVEHFKRYMDILAHPRLFDDEAKDKGIQTAVLCHGIPIVKPLVHFLGRNPAWRPVHFDEVAVVFVREDQIKTLGLEKSLEESEMEVARRLTAEETQVDWEVPILQRLNLRYSKTDRLKPLVQLADGASMLGDLNLSKRSLDGAINLNSGFSPAWSSLCRISYLKVSMDAERAGKVDMEAVRSVESTCMRSLELGGDIASANQVLGLLMLNTQRPRQAIPYFEKVLWIDPLSFEGRFMLAQAYRGLGGEGDSIEKAKLNYKRASDLRPFEPLPILQLASILEQENKIDQALPLFEHAYQLGPDPNLKKKIEELQGRVASVSRH